MIKKIILCIILFVSCFISYSQKATITGFVEDIKSGERLIAASVYDKNSMHGISTNNYGFYSLSLNKGTVNLICSYVGYKPFNITFNLQKDTIINIYIDPVIQLSEVVVVGKKDETAVKTPQMSSIEIPVMKIKSLPVLFGEVDVLKTIQLLPGVQAGNEGTSGFYVRGGGADQNLILLDGVTVYNVDHLFGFFSVFNADAIQSVELIKGGFPARYGGRLSSVLDIYMKEGNNKKFKAEGSIGLISSKIAVEGPIIKNKSSFIFSARRTYIDLLAMPFIKAFSQYKNFNAGYYFYDINAKINHQLSNKHRLFLSFYMGNDKAYSNSTDDYYSNGIHYIYKNKARVAWGNITNAYRWNYIINKKLFSNTTLTFSRYRFVIGTVNSETVEENKIKRTTEFDMKYFSSIEDIGGKIDFDYMPVPNHTIKFGYNNIYHTFKPGVNSFRYSNYDNIRDNIDTSYGNKYIYSNELAVYIEDNIKFDSKTRINTGIRYSGFYVNEKYYNAFEPRISGRYLLNEFVSLKGAFSMMNQYIHLLTNARIGLPTDLWLPVTTRIKPMKSIQYAAGGVYSFKNKIDFTIEGFYKTMDNIIEYKEGASFFTINEDWQNKVETGRGWSYGVELLIQKNEGKTTGWIGYTLSWSNRQFDNINFGKPFPYKYDRRHDISIVITHQLDENIDGGFTWVYGTGNAVTLAYEKYPSAYNIATNYVEGAIEYYGSRNSYRMPSYHRLDIGVNFHKEKKWGVRTFSVGIYNVYNRKNPYFLSYGRDLNGNRVLKQYSLFPMIPSVRYSFKIK